MIKVKYVYGGIEHQNLVKANLGEQAIGRRYFIKLLPKDPDALVFLKEYPVPECLLLADIPKEGWKEMPSCQ